MLRLVEYGAAVDIPDANRRGRDKNRTRVTGGRSKSGTYAFNSN